MPWDEKRVNPYVGTLSVKIVIDESVVGVIDSKDIAECYFIEDIFSPCITGKLVFYDVYGLLEDGPFTGNEMISLVYGIEQDRELIFHIWNVKRIVQASEVNSTAESLFELHFVDQTYYNMFVQEFSRSFSEGTLYTDVVKHIFENMVGRRSENLKIEKSKNALHENWAMPYWSPIEGISWLLKKSVGVESGTSGYVFYNNTDGGFRTNVYTLNYLFSGNNVIDAQDYIFEGENEETPNKIYEWWISGIDKGAMKTGVFGGSFKGFNPHTKKLLENKWSFSNGVANTMIMGKKSFLPDISDLSSSIQLGSHTEEELLNELYDKWLKKYTIQFAVNIVLPGNERRYAGHQIQVRWPSRDTVQKKWQRQLEGKYLVKSITHSFIGSERSNINYMQRIILLKNGFQDSNSKALLSSTKINTLSRNQKSFKLVSSG